MTRLRCCRGGQDQRGEDKKQHQDALGHNRLLEIQTLSHEFVENCARRLNAAAASLKRKNKVGRR
jgi:hypothetical protein